MNIHKISAATIARTACLLLALTNQLLSACGKPVLPIESQTVEQLVTAGITTVAELVEQQQLHRRRHSGRRRIRPPEAERRVNRHPNGVKVILFKLEVLLFYHLSQQPREVRSGPSRGFFSVRLSDSRRFEGDSRRF